MDYYCKHCASPVVWVGTRIEKDVWEHEEFNPNCGKAELSMPEADDAYADRYLDNLLKGNE